MSWAHMTRKFIDDGGAFFHMLICNPIIRCGRKVHEVLILMKDNPLVLNAYSYTYIHIVEDILIT